MSSFFFVRRAIHINWIKSKTSNDLSKIDKIQQRNLVIRIKIYSKYGNWKTNAYDNKWWVFDVHFERHFMAKN